MRIEITLLKRSLFSKKLSTCSRLMQFAALIGALLFIGNANAQIAQRGTSTNAEVNNNTTISISKPTGVVANDIMIAVLGHSNTSSNAMAAATSSGWTLINSTLYTSSGNDRWRLSILYKVATAGDSGTTSYSFNLQTGTRDGVGTITAFSGVNISDPFDATATVNSGASSSVTATALSSVTDNAMIMMIAGVAAQQPVTSWTATSPATLTEVFDRQDNAGADQSIAAAIGTKTTAGSTGNGIGALAASRSWTATMLALKPVTIATGTIDGSPFCGGGAVSVPYTIAGPYNSNNTFTAQLSDASGSFATPTVIGSIANTNTAGSISATIPSNQPAGTGYRIRVVSSSPAAVGTANTTDLTIATVTANAGTPITTCETSGAINITAGASASGQTGVLWTSSGTGTFTDEDSLTLATYTPSAEDIAAGTVTLTLNASGTCPTSSNKVLTINKVPTASAGGSATTCVNQPVVVSGASASNGTILWTEDGAGSITAGANTLMPTYTPAAGDIGVPVTLTMTVSNAPCTDATATFTVNVKGSATADAGTAITTCSNSGAVNVTAGSSAADYSSVEWTSSGTGSFTNANSLTLAEYTPSEDDITAGSVTLTLTAVGIAPCANASSNKTLTINAEAVSNAGSDLSMCASTNNIQMAGSRSGFGVTSSTWSTSGTGTFNNTGNLNANYTPSDDDRAAGSVVLTLTTNDPAGPCGAGVDTMVLTINPSPTLSGVSQSAAVCENTDATIVLSGLIPDSTSDITYTINNGSPEVIVGVVADNSGAASILVSVTFANNGQQLAITNIHRTDLAVMCDTAPVSNNTVTLQVIAGVTYYEDADDDGFGNPEVTTVACPVAPEGFVADNTDCDDTDNTKHTTFGFYADEDNDGYGAGAEVMLCAVDANTPPTAGFVANSDDCDDTKASVNPGATEIGYNLIDDDCDGFIDEGFPPKVTQLQSTFCNSTLATLDTPIVANIVAGAQGYRWRITALNGPNMGQVQFLDTPLRVMKFTQLSNYAFNTQYEVMVAVYYAGFLQPYTNACNVTTPSPTTQLSNCGTTLSLISDPIYANLVPFAAGYRFKVTDPLNPINTQTIDRPIRDFRMTMVTNFAVQYSKTYNVEVSVKNTDGTYMTFGAMCLVATPVFPTTSLLDEQCEDFAVPDANTYLYAYSYPGAIAYVFKVTGPGLPGAGIEVTHTTRAFRLSEISGLIPGEIYNVQVRLIFNESDPPGPYGKTCTVVAPGSGRPGIKSEMAFDAIAHPNPFTDNFNIVLTGPASEVSVKVYDMTGRLLENTKFNSDEPISVGGSYPSGIYNVVVNQGNDVKTLRVVKR